MKSIELPAMECEIDADISIEKWFEIKIQSIKDYVLKNGKLSYNISYLERKNCKLIETTIILDPLVEICGFGKIVSDFIPTEMKSIAPEACLYSMIGETKFTNINLLVILTDTIYDCENYYFKLEKTDHMTLIQTTDPELIPNIKFPGFMPKIQLN